MGTQSEDSGPGTDDERRAFDRERFEAAATLILDDGTRIDGDVVNVSLTGFLFRPNKRTLRGARLQIHLAAADVLLAVEAVDETDCGVHLEIAGHDVNMRDLAARHEEIARLFLPYLHPEDDD